MRCKICGESFYRGTSTLPNDYCADCCDKYITYVEVKRTTKKIIDSNNKTIQYLQNDIEKYKREIKKCEETIEILKEQIRLV